MGSDKAKPAYCEDVDATSGRVVRESRRSAAVKPKVSYREDTEKRESRSGKHRKSRSDATFAPEQSTSASQHVEIISQKDMKLERRKSSSSSTKSPRKSNRPPSAHENRTFPKTDIPSSLRVNPNHFGIPTPTTRTASAAVSQPVPLRPRAVTSQTHPRPLSYHAAQTSAGSQGPPLSMSAYYQRQPIITPSYPPPSPSSSYMQYAAPQPPYAPQLQYTPQYTPQYSSTPQPQYSMSAQPQYSVTPQQDYFAPHAVSRPLSSRFDPIGRPASAFDPVPRTTSAFGSRERGSRVLSDYDAYYDDGYTSAAEGATIRKTERRGSIRVPSSTSTMSKAEADSRAMPPPTTRPGILRRTTEYSVDPKSDPGVGGYYDRDTREEYRDESRPRRPSVSRHSVSYDLGTLRVEAANSGRRRQTWYEQPISAGASKYEQPSSAGASSAYETKLNQAATYQEEVAGGPTVPLTAEVLKRQQRRQGGSSRSTKSSASRDESDYKKSATTRTTRSGSGDNDENVTIKVTGQARVMVGGTQIDTDGGEIEIRRQKSLKNGSERSNSEYGGGRIEDRRSRVDARPMGRSRMSSQSGESYTRTPRYPRDDNYF